MPDQQGAHEPRVGDVYDEDPDFGGEVVVVRLGTKPDPYVAVRFLGQARGDVYQRSFDWFRANAKFVRRLSDEEGEFLRLTFP